MLVYPLFIIGLVGVLAGAHLLVLGSSRIAASLGIPPVVIGLTIVGFGTSAPEIIISGLASYHGNPDTALGNIVGSNIANVGLVLGATALLYPLRPDRTVLRREGPVMVAVSLVILALAFSGSYERWHGGLMLLALAGFLAMSLFWSRDATPSMASGDIERIEPGRPLFSFRALPLQIGYVVVGSALLFGGGEALIESATTIADDFGIPEFVIASTVVAIGTSVPEMATSFIAALRRQADIAVGNIIGSNIFNLLCVLGIASSIGVIPVEGLTRVIDMPVMVAFSLVAVAMARWNYHMSRAEGGLLLAAYIAYIAYLLMR